MKLILLNGPPRCGKDTAARILCRHYHDEYTVRWEKFSYPHKRAFAAITDTGLDNEGNNGTYEPRKSEVIPWLGVSYRQWQIDFSEKFMKPLYGPTIFARMFLERQKARMNTDRYLCLVSDCGFQIEVDTIAAVWPPDDLITITIKRDGCTFDGDSRQYVSPTIYGEAYETIYNNIFE